MTTIVLADAAVSSKGFRMTLKPDQPGGVSNTSSATGTCNLRIERRGVMLHFEADAFKHATDATTEVETFLQVRAVQVQAGLIVSPSVQNAQTDLAKDRDTAGLAVGVAGTGVATLAVSTSLPSTNVPSGNYRTNLTMTVTAN